MAIDDTSTDTPTLCMQQKVDESGRYDAYCAQPKGHIKSRLPHEYVAGYMLDSVNEDKLLLKFTISKSYIDSLVYIYDEDWIKSNTRGPFVDREDAKKWAIDRSVLDYLQKYAHPLRYQRKRVETSEDENGTITVEVYV